MNCLQNLGKLLAQESAVHIDVQLILPSNTEPHNI
jgi:hypothetical protein